MDDVNVHLKGFGLTEQPFAPTADPDYFYASRDHKTCLFQLWSTIDERHGIAVVLGNYGTGKTTLLRKLMTGMATDPEKYNTAVIGSPIPSWTSFSLLEAIIQQFRLSPEKRSFASYMESLNRYLIVNRDRVNTLIIDDAQNLNKRGQLELLRLAQNLETPQHKLLNLVLFAQLEWARVLQAAPNFEQRVNMTYTLEVLTVEEVAQFIEFRLSRAGATPGSTPSFQSDAIQLIHTFSEGNPRVIVTLCRNALMFATQTKKSVIDRDVIVQTIDKTTLPNSRKIALARGSLVEAESRALESATPDAMPVVTSERRALDDTIVPATVVRTNSNRANELLLKANMDQARGR
ncbi:MAG: AAA family ATPase [Candidatus Hydrogenedentota bacterium]